MIIYKYRPVNDFAFQLLENNEFYLSLPKDFNDPFDCYIRRDNNNTKEEWIDYIENESDATLEEKRKLLKELSENNFDIGKVRSDYDTFYRDVSLYVCCFSAVNDNILLWSHYANCHRGVAFGFETKQIDELEYFNFDEDVNMVPRGDNYCDLYKVIYGKIPEAYNFIKSIKANRSTKDFFYTKSPEWEYEKEYRLIFYADILKKQKIKFHKGILKEIIFGLDIDGKDKNKIFDCVIENYLTKGFDVKFYQCKRKEDEYGVDIIDLNFN